MVGEGVLLECLNDATVEQVLVFGRRPCGHSHPKMKEILHADFLNISSLADHFRGYDACFFCLGVSSVGMKEPEYTRLTHQLTLHCAEVMHRASPNMVFCYVSGAGTDATEKGRQMWARVKGRTENDLQKVGFSRVYAFRPGMMTPTKGAKHTLKLYFWIGWLAPIIRALAPHTISTLAQVGRAMINVVKTPYANPVLEVNDIKQVAK